MPFEHYIQSGGKCLRYGFTTGTCAALAAAGATRRLITGIWPKTVSLMTPKGLLVEVPLERCRTEKDSATCAVRKDAGDDIDVTAGILIEAKVCFTDTLGINIESGVGVGRVTKPGLDQPIGEAAINRVPRQMITNEVEDLLKSEGISKGVRVIISVPNGREIAKKTFNQELGIKDGISILGTSGIVEPMSTQALVDTIVLQLRQVYALGHRQVILTPGNYGMDFLAANDLFHQGIPIVKCSNFIGEALDECAAQGFESVLLVGHAGKLIKLAGGIMNTHSRYADCRTELFCAHAAVCGGDQDLCRALMDAATSEACLKLLDQAGLRQEVMESLMAAIDQHLKQRVAGAYQIGALLFTNSLGEVGRTAEVKEIIAQWTKKAEHYMV